MFCLQLLALAWADAPAIQVEGQRFSLLEASFEPTPEVNGAPAVPVELMRYVTPYSQNFDVETDVTHHMANFLGKDKLHLYSMIDTWVGGMPTSFITMNDTSNVCQTMVPPDAYSGNGNGFDLKADLHFYEKKDSSEGQTTQVLPVFTATPFASWAHLGEMEATSAVLGAGGAIRPEDMPKCQGGPCAGSPTVYRCEYPEAGNCLHQIRNSMKQHGEFGGFSLLEREEAQKVHRSDLGDTRDIVEELDGKERRYKVHLERGDVGKSWHVGDKVYAPKHVESNSAWGGRSYNEPPMAEAGFVEKLVDYNDADSTTGFAEIKLRDGECVPSPVSNAMNTRAWKVATTAGRTPTGEHSPLTTLNMGLAEMVKPEVYSLKPTGASFLQGSDKDKKNKTDNLAGTQVVLVAQSAARLLQKTVDFGEPLKPNERMIAHFVSSGHGWEHTNKQCGEFCKVNYRLTADSAGSEGEGYSLLEAGSEAAAFSLWRDDCGQNPLDNQQGTWTISRNGWCPGAVSNGYFADVTSLVEKGGMHKVGVEATVDGTNPYVNTGGFAYKDPAKLEVGLTFFRYAGGAAAKPSGGNATSSFVESERPVSFVEFVNGVKGGSSASAAESTASEETEERMATSVTDEGGRITQLRHSNYKRSGRKLNRRGDTPTEDGFLGSHAPWFQFNEQKARKPDVTVPLFSGVIHQMSNRVITADVPTPNMSLLDMSKKYNVGLRLQLLNPPSPLQVDRWDRYATFGMFMPEAKAMAKKEESGSDVAPLARKVVSA